MTTREFYIAPNGDDANTGTSPDAPLRTVAEVRRRGWDAGDDMTLHLAEGSYDRRDVFGKEHVDDGAYVVPPLVCSSRLPRVGQSRDERRRCLVRGER